MTNSFSRSEAILPGALGLVAIAGAGAALAFDARIAAFACLGVGALAANLLFSLERRAIREVWIGGRQVVTNGRHAAHGPIVARFVELQRRLWGGPGGAPPSAA